MQPLQRLNEVHVEWRHISNEGEDNTAAAVAADATLTISDSTPKRKAGLWVCMSHFSATVSAKTHSCSFA